MPELMSTAPDPLTPPPRALVVAAFAAVYLIWGSTYLGIRFAVETLPPFLMGGARFLLAGAILYSILRLRGVSTPGLSHWRNALVVGALLLGIGNGAVNWAEQFLPSGITALLIALTPIWFALLDWIRPGGTRPPGRVWLGILLGFGGVALLIRSPAEPNTPPHPLGVLAILLAGLAWASGSLYARYTPKPMTPLMGVALQMLMGGALLLLIGFVSGETKNFEWTRVSFRSQIAFVYLTLVGSLVGFTAFSWLLKVSTPTRISTYAYVNPVIAVFLGWWIAGEHISIQMMWGAAVIILGVMIILIRKSTPETAAKPAGVRSLAPHRGES